MSTNPEKRPDASDRSPSSDLAADGGTRAASPERAMVPPPGDPPRDVANVPSPSLKRDADELSDDQWSRAWREFRKRKGAVLALVMILFLVTISVFAPLLANNRPIAYRGANRFEYSEAARGIGAMIVNAGRAADQLPEQIDAAREALARVDNAPEDLLQRLALVAEESRTQLPTELAEVLAEMETFITERETQGLSRTVRRDLQTAHRRLNDAVRGVETHDVARDSVPGQFDRMIALVVPETGEALRQLQEESNTALSGKIDVATANQLRQSLRDYSDRDVLFQSQWRFPVFAALNGMALACLVLNTLVLLVLAYRMMRRRPWPPRQRRKILWGLVLIPLLSGLLWELLLPDRIDRTPYKLGVSVAEAAENSAAPVVYEMELWPPIAYGLDEGNLDAKLVSPRIFGGSEEEIAAQSAARYGGPHWLGTDAIGRDTLCRMLWGGRVSLAVGIVAVSIYVAIGIVVGAVAGFFRGWVDMVISRIIEVVIVFPAFFLILTIVAFVGPSLWNIMLVIGLTGWTGVARLVRGEFLRLADQEFVIAGRALGYGPGRLIFRHILPNAMAPVLVAATFGVAGAILTESALSFLGIGITIPTPSWGNILADGRDFNNIAPWLIYFPGLTIFITILCYNLAGEALRDALDPRLRGSR